MVTVKVQVKLGIYDKDVHAKMPEIEKALKAHGAKEIRSWDSGCGGYACWRRSECAYRLAGIRRALSGLGGYVSVEGYVAGEFGPVMG